MQLYFKQNILPNIQIDYQSRPIYIENNIVVLEKTLRKNIIQLFFTDPLKLFILSIDNKLSKYKYYRNIDNIEKRINKYFDYIIYVNHDTGHRIYYNIMIR